ncbi:MAG TPA: acyl-CoA dehydrogenase family protein [Acidimicrobiales bacterium]|nr:acyl-CoA dehydrogenase family protein [Acidimicrobiales bacterium]
MDFDLSDEQQATIDLAAKLLGDKATPEAIRALETGGGAAADERFDRALWAAMADAGLLGIAVPAEHGGAGLGLLELCLVLEEVGRRAAPVPALGALALGGLPVARFGSEAQRAALLPGLAAGTTVLTAALTEPLGDAAHPTTTATRDGDGWVLDGARTNVPAGLVADAVLVPATTGDGDGGVGVFVVPGDAAGVGRQRQDTTTGTPEALVTLDGVRLGGDAVLGPVDEGTVLRFLVEHATVAACAVMAGLTAEAVRMTGEYTTAREQFGRPIATFQAVGQRAADAYVDAHAIRLTMLQAAWRLANGAPADREVAIAKYWASAGGQRVVHAAQHLHGGMGVDRDYPLHRYFLLAKQLELYLGGASRQLLALGRILAAEGPTR